jgi:CRISPR-associated protein Cas2
MSLSAYKGMWLVAMFDLPVTSRQYRRAYARFRKELLKDGFCMLQRRGQHKPSEESQISATG